MSKLSNSLAKKCFALNVLRGKYKLNNLLPNNYNHLCSVLMYHGIDDNEWATLDIPQRAFFDEIKFYQQQGYEIKASSSLLNHYSDKPVLVLTFDDGNKNILATLKNLIDQKIHFTIAICPGVIDNGGAYWFEELLARIQFSHKNNLNQSLHELERCKSRYFAGKITRQQLLEEYRSKTSNLSTQELLRSQAVHENLNWNELRQLVATGYCDIASHTMFHDAITMLDPEQLKIDLSDCNLRIQQELGVNCEQFICPFGDYNEEYQQVLDDCGYQHTYLSNNKLNVFDSTHIKVIDRLKGVGYGNFSLRYFEYLWLQNHQIK